MSEAGFWVLLGVVIIAAVVVTAAGAAWASRGPPGAEPTEHGDGEP